MWRVTLAVFRVTLAVFRVELAVFRVTLAVLLAVSRVTPPVSQYEGPEGGQPIPAIQLRVLVTLPVQTRLYVRVSGGHLPLPGAGVGRILTDPRAAGQAGQAGQG